MCLVHREKDTKKLKKKFGDSGEKLILHKLVYIESGNMTSVHRDNPMRSGTLVSNRTTLLVDQWDMYNEINRGIHVFTTLREAKKYLRKINRREAKQNRRGWKSHQRGVLVIIPVTVFMKDLVAAGLFYAINVRGRYHSAVFMKVTINQDDFDAAIQKEADTKSAV